MSGRLKKHFFLLVPIVFLVLLYFLTRLSHLTVIPVFCDEAIYIRWAQIMRTVPSLRFIPLSDGKQPLFMWLVIPFLKVFKDPLVAGRMVSVLSGFGTMLGIGVLSFILFKKVQISLLAIILYLISPFIFFFDRMALVDGFLSFFGVWCLVLGVSLAKKIRLDLAMILGIILGLGLITKSPAIFFGLLLPFCLLATNNVTMKQLNNLVKLAILYFVVYIFAFTIYNILRLGPEFHMIAIRNKDYIYSFSEILKHPFSPLWGNLKSVAEWYWILLTPLVFISGIFGIYLLLKKELKIGLFSLLWWLLPILGQSAVAKVYTARYILFTIPVFIIFAAFSLEEIFGKVKRRISLISLISFIIFFFPIIQIVLLLFNPQKAWLPKNEREGYLEIWTSGYGIKEASVYLKEIAKNQKVLVGTEGYFGTLPDGLQMYLEGVPNITTIGVGQPIREISSKLLDGLKDNRVFLLVNDTRFEVKNTERLNLIAKYPKAKNLKTGTQESLLFFEVKEK